MTLQDLGNIGEFIASLGVIASLIYLAVQVRQSTAQMGHTVRSFKVSAYQEMSGRVVDFLQVVMSDSGLAAIINKARDSPAELTAAEKRQYTVYVLALERNADAAFFQYEQGLLTKDGLGRLVDAFVHHLAVSEPGRSLWNGRQNVSENFRRYIDGRLRVYQPAPGFASLDADAASS